MTLILQHADPNYSNIKLILLFCNIQYIHIKKCDYRVRKNNNLISGVNTSFYLHFVKKSPIQ